MKPKDRVIKVLNSELTYQHHSYGYIVPCPDSSFIFSSLLDLSNAFTDF